MADTINIEVRKVLFPYTSPKIVADPTLLDGNRLTLDPKSDQFHIDVVIKQNLQVRFTEWEKPIRSVVASLLAQPKISSLVVNVTYESKIYAVGQIGPATIPQEAVDMVTNSFRRLRGIAHADVSGLGADGRSLVEAMTKPKDKPTTTRRPTKRGRDEDEGAQSDTALTKIATRTIKRARGRRSHSA